MHTVTKSYRDYPAAHRQPNHDGHCRLIHGHNWSFDLTFDCEQFDECGFVIDIGKLKHVKDFLDDKFDHTLLLNDNDLERDHLTELLGESFAKIVLVPNCGMEGLAEWLFVQIQTLLSIRFPKDYHTRGLRLIEVTVWEDSKNRATYCQ